MPIEMIIKSTNHAMNLSVQRANFNSTGILLLLPSPFDVSGGGLLDESKLLTQ